MEKKEFKTEIPKNWPDKGVIKVENIEMRYRPGLPLVLKNLSFQVEENEKIGIVGRTGSGKSSIFLVLTRLLELENISEESYITIDGIKIHDLNLQKYRENR